MTNQEAIETIEANYPPENYSMLREALDMAIAKLKEQEAVKPEVDYICGNIVNVCGKCKSNLIARVKFCPWCGKEVKWK